MELVAVYKRVIGLDVHQAQISACALIEEADGSTRIDKRQFGGFKRDRRQLAQWAASLRPDEVVMESTGIDWKSPYAALEAVGLCAKVVHARYVKNVPGRKTDVGDAHWLAMLARAGLLCGSFVPLEKLRELRLIARQRQKLVGQLASEKNRLHKVLTDLGVRLGVVVSDLHGKSARAMVKAIIAGQAPHEVLKRASARLKASREELLDALQGELTANHRFVLDERMHHIEEIEARIARFDARLLAKLQSEHNALALLQTIAGVDRIGAAMLLIEIGTNMEAFGSADRLASWVGICPGNHESAGKRKSPAPARATPMYAVCCASLLMPPAVPTRCSSNRSSSPSSFGGATSAPSSPSSPSATRFCAPSSSCSSGANITGIAPPTMRRSPFNATPRAGSRS
jgi:transposase